MGIIPGPTEFSTQCPICFPLGSTPKYVKCFFSGIRTGELWHSGLPGSPNGYFDLETDPIRYCIWVISRPGPWGIEWKLMDTYSRLLIWTQGVRAFEATRTGVLCSRHFSSQYEWPENRYYYGGHGYIATSAEIASKIKSVTPMFDPDPRMELFPMADDHIAVRYAGKRDATNVMIKFDTNH